MDTQTKAPRFQTRIALDESTRKELVDLLNISLASTFDLFSQVKQAHWNLKGAQFVARHELFDKLSDRLRGFSDDLAERATTLGGYATGTIRLSCERTVLPEYDLDAVDGRAHLLALADRYGVVTNSYREMIAKVQRLNDPATEDLLTEVLRETEMDLWFIEAHLQD